MSVYQVVFWGFIHLSLTVSPIYVYQKKWKESIKHLAAHPDAAILPGQKMSVDIRDFQNYFVSE